MFQLKKKDFQKVFFSITSNLENCIPQYEKVHDNNDANDDGND